MTQVRRCALLLACVLLTCAAAPRADAATFRLGERVLRIGAQGQDVRDLQRLLTRAGYVVAADGAFGPGTRSAVKTFQRRSRRQQTGVVGPGTVKVLRAAAAAAVPAADPSAVPDPAAGGADPDAPAAAPTAPVAEGGVTYGTAPTPSADPDPAPAATGPVGRATLTADGRAIAPSGAPTAVVQMIAAANRIARTPYRYGGGHGSFEDTAYDCSGSLSYALHGAGLLDQTLDSSSLARWGSAGPGRWVTIYANAEHTYMLVAGLRFDTSGQRATGSRWQDAPRSSAGFTVRHPKGL